MKKLTLLIFVPLLLIFLTGADSSAGVIHPRLQLFLQSLDPQDEISVIITLSEKADIKPFKDQPKSLRRTGIIKALKSKADLTQRPLQAFLQNRKTKKIKSLWLINGIVVTTTADVIDELAALPEVESIRLDAAVQLPEVTLETTSVPEWNLDAIRAPELWALGYTGAGVVVADMDTGVDVEHPDLMTRWRGGTNSWFDPHGEHPTPFDSIGHGTNAMGVMVGGDAGGTAIGVAPGAQWIAVKIFNDAGDTTLSAIHQGFQWLLDPDGNPDTDDAPDVVNHSWGLDNVNGCSSEFEADIQALKTAGIAVAFAGGNSGPGPLTSISPANNPDGFAVGAVDQSFLVPSFSSRGPSACDGGIYPELAAPGVVVKTADLSFGGSPRYVFVTGTSISAPHVAGAMVLLLSALPNVTVSDLELVLKQSAFDLGPFGPDNDSGYGLLDVMRAYELILNPAPDISTSLLSHQFGETKEGSLSSPQIFTVANRGIEDLTLGDVSITGLNASDFIKQNDTCTGIVLPPSGNCTVQMVFSPTSAGMKSAFLSIPSNDADANPLNIQLSGTGLEQYLLSVIGMGSGTGKITSATASIDCGADCQELFSPGTGVTLKAISDVESSFGGWSGCTTVFGTTCMLAMNGDNTVTATFVGPSITVVSPNGGEEWKPGTFKRITWGHTGNPGASISIGLFKGGTLHTTIASASRRGRRGIGYRYWRIPKDLPPGNDYEIKITSTNNNSYTDTSDSPFTISR